MQLRLLIWLHARAVNSVFTGEVNDQSQLYGLLDRLLDLGLELISVQRLVSRTSRLAAGAR
jgi:hypothetical protein